MTSFDEFHSRLKVSNELDNHPHVPEERAEEFRTTAFEAAEIEYLGLIYALIVASKPRYVLETGTFNGVASSCIASALRENENGGSLPGHLWTVESGDEFVHAATARLSTLGLSKFTTVVHDISLNYIRKHSPEKGFGLVFFDSSRADRVAEFRLLVACKLLNPGAILVFHDTSPRRAESIPEQKDSQDFYLSQLNTVAVACGGGLEFPLSRGLRVFQVPREKPLQL